MHYKWFYCRNAQSMKGIVSGHELMQILVDESR